MTSNHSSLQDLTSIVATLVALGCQPKPTNGGSAYTARCPCHDDSTPSLSISTGEKQPVILHCHAGCDPLDIFKKLDIQPAPATGNRRIVATYDYHDAQGALISQKVRYEPKDFRQCWPDGNGGWLWKRPKDATYVLYRLPEVLAAIAKGEPVYLAEGEKDADRLTALGLTATTNIEGAAKPDQKAKWRKDYTAQLSGAARVILIPDNDEPGRAHMAHVAKQLGQRATVVNLSGIPEKGDVSDWLDQGHTAAELKALADNAEAGPGSRIDDEPVTEFDRFHPDLMRKSGTSELLKNHYNAVLVVQNALPGLIGFNEFRQRIETRRLTPWGKEPGEWTETDTAELACLLAKPYASFSLNVLAPAVMTVAHRNKFNPANERLRELSEQWDKTPRLQTWLIDHFNAAHNPLNDAYLREIGEKWMVGVAARVLFPGCKRDDVLILRGQQGLMKSTAAAAIADCIQPDSFSDCLGDLSGKEARSAIRGLVIAELGELAALNKSDMESTKAFVAAKKDRFREAYGRGERDYPRTVSFIGTTNDPTFLKDPTGNRRWWPVTVERNIDMQRFNDVLPQLLGEAAHKAMAGEPWFVSDKTALQQADAVRRAHYDDDPLTDAILAAAKNRFEPITIAGLMSAIGLRVDQQTMASQKRIAGILRINGYRDVRKKINGSRASVWEPVPPYDFTYGGTVAHGGTAPASEATVPPYEESTVAQVKASKQAAVPPCHPRPPYFEKKVKEAEKEVKEKEIGENLTNNLRFQGYIEKRVAHGGTVARAKNHPPVEASTPIKPAALICSWNDTGRLLTKCAKPEPTTDRTGCASCGAVKEGVAA